MFACPKVRPMASARAYAGACVYQKGCRHCGHCTFCIDHAGTWGIGLLPPSHHCPVPHPPLHPLCRLDPPLPALLLGPGSWPSDAALLSPAAAAADGCPFAAAAAAVSPKRSGDLSLAMQWHSRIALVAARACSVDNTNCMQAHDTSQHTQQRK